MISRRLLLHAIAVLPLGSRLASAPARATDELPDGPAPSAPPMRTIEQGAARYTVPGIWAEPVAPLAGSQPGPWMDSVNGPVADRIEVSATPTNLISLDDLGEISRVPLSKLGFDGLERADLVAAVRRQGSGDGVSASPYFDYDLALSPATCERDQEIVSGSCLPTRVVLLSCTVRSGKLHALRVDASPAQWRKAGTTLRDVRRSFTVT